MRILSAVYLPELGEKKEVYPSEITPRIYETELKGKLYCPTENCLARISFSGGKTSHFRTWRYDEHSSDCIFYFDRIPMNLGKNTTNTISVEITFNRRKNALQDAFIQMNLTKEEKEALLEKRATSRARTIRRGVTVGRQNATSMQLVLFDGELYEDELVHRRRNISKRFVDEISESDVGEIRLIMGEIISIKRLGEIAEIVVGYNNEVITVVFEEAFTADPLNSSYLNKFWSIERLLDRLAQIQFTGIGDVRKNGRTNRLELVVYAGTDFKINNIDMFRLAAQFAWEDLE